MIDAQRKIRSVNWSTVGDLGPLAALLNDDNISDILVNGPKEIYIERSGKLEKTDISFPDEATLFGVAERIASAIGRTLEVDRPLIDARLPDGSRVNIIAPPLAVDGTSISIRKFFRNQITIDDMIKRGSVSQSLGEFLKIAGHCRMNIVFSGGTGSGKTTLLNAISRSIDNTDRIVTIEDAVELQLQQPHVVRLETKTTMLGQSTAEEVSIRDLLRNALRMRPDRIIVGEVRGPEAFDMLQAMNTGHEGSLTTIHANHPRDALSRLENMISMANPSVPLRSIRAQIASSIHLIIQTSRMRDGVRRVTFVTEIAGMEGDIITMNDLFQYVVDGEAKEGKLIGRFEWTGIMPRYLKRIAYYGELEHLTKALGIKMPKG